MKIDIDMWRMLSNMARDCSRGFRLFEFGLDKAWYIPTLP